MITLLIVLRVVVFQSLWSNRRQKVKQKSHRKMHRNKGPKKWQRGGETFSVVIEDDFNRL